jgi:hypothetical protein
MKWQWAQMGEEDKNAKKKLFLFMFAKFLFFHKRAKTNANDVYCLTLSTTAVSLLTSFSSIAYNLSRRRRRQALGNSVPGFLSGRMGALNNRGSGWRWLFYC